MVALLHPGVYVQEVSSGARSIEGVPTSIPIFVGETERGTLGPVKIRSLADYVRLFGGYQRHSFTNGTVTALTPIRVTMRYAMDLFYQNGGTVAYILRASTNAQATQRPGTGTPVVSAASPGEWGKEIYAVFVEAANGRFRIVVYYRAPGQTGPAVVEDWDRLTTDPADSNYVGAVLSRSSYLVWTEGATPITPADITLAEIAGGTNPLALSQADLNPTRLASPDLATNNDITFPTTSLPGLLAQLDGVDDAALLVGTTERWVNGVIDTIQVGFTADTGGTGVGEIRAYYDALRAYTINRPKQDLFYIADIPSFAPATSLLGTPLTNDPVASARVYVSGQATGPTVTALTTSTFAGVYWPHFRLADPVGPTLSSTRLVPPSAALAGLYARIDARRGVWKAPAGTEATIFGIARLENTLFDVHQDELNPLGINVVRPIPGAGTVVWGSRTLVPASEWRYVPVRRTALFLRKSIFNGIQFAVFEPNDKELWSTLRATIGAFMETQFRNGAFAGSTSSDAYFVKVDEETTTPEDQAAGVVNILVGFAPLRPAEFVVVRLSQKTATAA
jgi:phage tail sheath protein FI